MNSYCHVEFLQVHFWDSSTISRHPYSAPAFYHVLNHSITFFEHSENSANTIPVLYYHFKQHCFSPLFPVYPCTLFLSVSLCPISWTFFLLWLLLITICRLITLSHIAVQPHLLSIDEPSSSLGQYFRIFAHFGSHITLAVTLLGSLLFRWSYFTAHTYLICYFCFSFCFFCFLSHSCSCHSWCYSRCLGWSDKHFHRS